MNKEELIERFTEELWSFRHGYVSRDDVRTIVDIYRNMMDRAEKAEAECKRLESSRDGYARKSDAHEKIAEEWQARALAAEAKVEIAKQTLRFYVEPTGDFIPDFYSEMDFGETARAALKAMEATNE